MTARGGGTAPALLSPVEPQPATARLVKVSAVTVRVARVARRIRLPIIATMSNSSSAGSSGAFWDGSLTRRGLLLAAVAGAGGCSLRRTPGAGSPLPALVQARERMRRSAGAQVVNARVTAAPVTVDLGGRLARTWAYDGAIPGRTIRVRAGDVLKVTVVNGLPERTSVHWHGVALRNDADGVPGLTGPAVEPGSQQVLDFTLPDPGTYFAHPHSGTQSDRGLYFPVVVEDPHEPVGYEVDETLMLDDWLDGTGAGHPGRVLAALRAGERPAPRATDAGSPWGPELGDVSYPLHLVNGRTPTSPHVVTARPGDRVRLRVVNAGADTAYRFGVAGHSLTVTHADGWPVRHTQVDTLLLGMGERYDVLLTAADGAFAITAHPEGKPGTARAVLRTTSRRAPFRETGLAGRLLSYNDLRPLPAARLPPRAPDRQITFAMRRRPGGYNWTFGPGEDHPERVRTGERIRLVLQNDTSMFHPVHVHGHTFALTGPAGAGVRKGTVVVRPGEQLAVDLDADNPGAGSSIATTCTTWKRA